MNARDLQGLVDYSAWATRRALAAARTVPAAAFTKELGGGFTSLRDVLVHAYGVDGLWLGRCGTGARRYPDHAAFGDAESLAAAWQPLQQSWAHAARSWSDGQVAAAHDYTSTEGDAHRSTLREIVLHCVNHACYHRGQAMTRVRRLGGRPVETGYAAFCWTLTPRASGVRVRELAELLDYSAWATMRAWIAVHGSGPECWTAQVPGSFACLRDLLHHLAFADWVWLRRVLGSAPQLPAARDVAGSTLVGIVHDLAARWRAFVAALDESQVDRQVRYRTLAGASASSSLREIVQHLVTHASYHRGQVSQLLGELGAKAAPTDLIDYFRERSREGRV